MGMEGIRKAIHQVNKVPLRPRLLAKVARGYFKTLVLRQSVLRVLEISINTACQSRCGYCYAETFKQPRGQQLTVAEIRALWQQAERMGAFCSLVLGGEPTLRKDFLDVIAALEPRKNLVTFTTNSISLTEAMVRELKRLGVFLVNISLDSPDPATNDRRRGYEGHFDAAMRAIEWCRVHGLAVTVPIVTSKSYFPQTLEMIDFVKRQGLVANLNLLTLSGRARADRADQFDAAFWDQLRALYASDASLRSDFNVNLSLKVECPAGFEKVHVAPYGDVTGCSLMSVSFGNVREEPLADIVGRMRQFPHFKKRPDRCLIAVDDQFIDDYQAVASSSAVTPVRVEHIESR